MKRLRHVAALFVLFAAMTSVAQVASEVSQEATPARALVNALQIRGALAPEDAKAIEAAAQLNPQIIEGAVQKAAGKTEAGTFVEGATPDQLTEMSRDLMNRAKLQALASGTIPMDPDFERRMQPYLSRTGAPDLPRVQLPNSVDSLATRSLVSAILVVKPLCPTGKQPSSVAGKTACIPGNPWSDTLFRSVVRIQVDGKRVCSGSVLGGSRILTAAHCVIERVGPEMAVIDHSRIAIVNHHGDTLPLSADPRVPAEMMWPCLPKCADDDYDFAVLTSNPSNDADWMPLPELSAITGSGEIPITIAGYGATTMPEGLSKTGLYIGEQRIRPDAEHGLEWNYSMPTETGSSSCSGDSGGPIFQGAPRQDGDKLALIGVISRLGSRDCFHTEARAVNLTQSGPRTTLCSYIPGQKGLCAP